MLSKTKPRRPRRSIGLPSAEALEKKELLAASFATIHGSLPASGKGEVVPIRVDTSEFTTWNRKPVLLDFQVSVDSGVGRAPGLDISKLKGKSRIVSGKASPDLVVALGNGSYSLKVSGASPADYTVKVSLAGDVDGDHKVDSRDVSALVSQIRSGIAPQANRRLLALARQNLGAATSIRPLDLAVDQEYGRADDKSPLTNTLTIRSAAGATVRISPPGGTAQAVVVGDAGTALIDARALNITEPTPTRFTATDSFGQRIAVDARVQSPTLAPLSGSEIPAFAGIDTTRLDDGQVLSALIVLRRNADSSSRRSLESLVADKLADRSYLSRDAMASLYGASKADLDAASDYFRANGLTVVYADAQTRTIRLTGTAENFGLALDVHPNKGNGRDFMAWGYEGELSVPSTLKDVVTAVIPVGNDINGSFSPLASSGGATSDASKSTISGSSDKGGWTGPDAVAHYDMPAVSRPGEGQSIGIIEMTDSYTQKTDDLLRAYFAGIGLPMPTINRYGPQTPDPDVNEMMLDLQVSGGIAPYADFNVFFGRGGLGALFETIQSAIYDPAHIDVLSISYGYAEEGMSRMEADAFTQIFLEAAAMGVTTFASSGDFGASGSVNDGIAHISFPASNPYVTSAGGTEIKTKADGTTEEVAWNDPKLYGDVYEHNTKTGTTTGGVSVVYGTPDYQSALALYSANPPGSSSTGLEVGRGGPDVAALAGSPYYRIVEQTGKLKGDGGTSAASPLWAALTAILDQQLEAEDGGKNVGFFNTILYDDLKGEGFTDVTEGNNETTYFTAPGGKVNVPTGIGYQAGVGWDMTTGWGVPDGKVLLESLKKLLKK